MDEADIIPMAFGHPAVRVQSVFTGAIYRRVRPMYNYFYLFVILYKLQIHNQTDLLYLVHVFKNQFKNNELNVRLCMDNFSICAMRQIPCAGPGPYDVSAPHRALRQKV